MKKLLSFIALAILFVSCSSDNEIVIKPKETKFYIAYKLDTSVGQSMTRSASDVWSSFYSAICNGSLVSESYDITFTNKETNVAYEFKGKWSDKEMFTLPNGTYNVTGTSTADGKYAQSRCSLQFNTTVDLNPSSNTTVTLNADYDCYLLAFNGTGIKKVDVYAGGWNYANMEQYDGYFYCFVQDKIYYYSDDYIIGTYTSGSTFKIYTYEAKFEKGKYYIYDNIPSSFNIPEMTSGM